MVAVHRFFGGAAVVAVGILALAAGPAAAAGPLAPPLAATYWSGFVDFWTGAVRNQNGITLIALGVGIVSIGVIASGKWVK